MESQLTTEKTRRISDAEEWKQFQCDLLMTVRVANDFQTEAQQNLEDKSNESEELRERIRLVENENERLKKTAANTRAVASITRTPPQASGGKHRDTRSQTVDSKATVKGLIDSIESAAKAKTAPWHKTFEEEVQRAPWRRGNDGGWAAKLTPSKQR